MRYSVERMVHARRMVQRAVLAAIVGLVACQPVRPVAELTPGVSGTIGGHVAEATGLPEARSSSSAPGPTADPTVLDAGLAVYRAQYCGVCHTLAPAGTSGKIGPSHDNLGSKAAERIGLPEYSGEATTPAEYIRESIVKPEAFLVPRYAVTPNRMPPYGHLPSADIDALVNFLSAQ